MFENIVSFAAAAKVKTGRETAIERVRNLINEYHLRDFDFSMNEDDVVDDGIALYHLIFDLYVFAIANNLDFDEAITTVKTDHVAIRATSGE